MEPITLQDLQQHTPDANVFNEMKRTLALWSHNLSVWRCRTNEEGPHAFAYELTHHGNEPLENHEMIDRAACYYNTGIFFDEEWKQFFIPAINKMIAYNDNFVRWLPGYVIRNKESGSKAIVEYDYATGFWGRDYTHLAVINLNDDGSLGLSWAWADYELYELVDTEHTVENIARIREKYKRQGSLPPYCLREEIARMFYGQPSRKPME